MLSRWTILRTESYSSRTQYCFFVHAAEYAGATTVVSVKCSSMQSTYRLEWASHLLEVSYSAPCSISSASSLRLALRISSSLDRYSRIGRKVCGRRNVMKHKIRVNGQCSGIHSLADDPVVGSFRNIYVANKRLTMISYSSAIHAAMTAEVLSSW